MCKPASLWVFRIVVFSNVGILYSFQVLQNRGLLYLDLNDIENALKDFSEAAKVRNNSI